MDNGGRNQTEVLIAGAGPVGLALALELQRFGVRFRIVEKKAERSIHSKALGLQPRLSEVFAILGVVDRFYARGFSGVRALNMNANGKKLVTLVLGLPSVATAQEACQPRLLIIPQSVTEEILETALAERGHLVERCRELVGFVQEKDFVSAIVCDDKGTEESITAKYLVGCEGAHSVVRKLAGFTFMGEAFPHRFILADLTMDWDLPDNEVQAWFHRDGTLAALPFGDGKWRLIAEYADDVTEVTLDLVRDLVTERTGLRNLRMRDPQWLSDFRINTRMVDRFRDRRVFVAGDAAHIHSPAGGQGIATGIQDAANLGWKLAACLRTGAPDCLLNTYDEERKPIAREVLGRTSAVSSVLFATNPFARLFRERLLAPVLRTTFVQKQLVTKLSQLEMNYRGRALSINHGRVASNVRIRAGDRVPDLVFNSVEGKVSLFQLIGKHGLIALVGKSAQAEATRAVFTKNRVSMFMISAKGASVFDVGDLEDLFGDFDRLFGAKGPFLYLIRPDGHVGLFQQRANAEMLARYLKKIRETEPMECGGKQSATPP